MIERLRTICEEFLDEAMEYNDLPGLVIGVTCGLDRDGTEDMNSHETCAMNTHKPSNMGDADWYTFTGARGVRDVLTGDPMQPDDVFHCASVSKLFTSSAIMKLVEEGVIHLDDRLCDILPEFGAAAEQPDTGDGSPIADKRWEKVTIRQMLSHTAGIGDVDDYHWEEALTSETALADYVHSDEVRSLPLLWEPGEGGFRYSNIAYEILGHVVSVKSAEYAGGACREQLSYEEYVHKYLMQPAGMTNSTMLTFERIGAKAGESCPLIMEEIRRRNAQDAAGKGEAGSTDTGRWHAMALPHEKADDRSIVPVKYYPYTRSHGPSSTLTSTAADLLKWARAHMKGFAAAEQLKQTDEPEPAELKQTDGPEPAEQSGNAGPLLSARTYQLIGQEYATVPNNGEKMGLGWFMRRQRGYQLYGHEGTDDGFRASLWMCPEKETAICVLSNLSGAPVKKLNKKLFDRLIPELP